MLGKKYNCPTKLEKRQLISQSVSRQLARQTLSMQTKTKQERERVCVSDEFVAAVDFMKMTKHEKLQSI